MQLVKDVMMESFGKLFLCGLAIMSVLAITTGCAPKEDPMAPSAINAAPAAGTKQATAASPLPGHSETELKQVQQEDDAAAKRSLKPL